MKTTRTFAIAAGLLLSLAGLARAADNAAFVSQSIPGQMNTAQVYAVSVTMQNTGTTTWTAASSYKAWVQTGNTWGISQVVPLGASDSVAPGASYTFNFNVTSPATPGIYNLQLQMLDGGTLFGAPAPNVAVAVGAVNYSSFVSQSTIPTSMTANQSYPVTITMQNAGGTTWTPGNYSLQPQNTAWSPARVDLAASVAPGQSATFSFNAVPLTGGSKPFVWKMAQGTTTFGASSTSVNVSISGTDNATYVSQNIPSPMNPGQVYPVSVTMTNTGNTTWSEANLFRGWVPSGGSWGIPSQRVIMPAGDSVPPGATYTFNFNMTAPTTPGIYNFQFQMVHDGVAVFGQAAPALSIAVGAVNFSSFVSQSTIPTSMTAGQSYPVTITMQNTGGTTWAPGTYSLQPQNAAWSPSHVDLAASVPPGQSATFSFNVVPLTGGSKPFAWKMAQGTTAFGASTTSVNVSLSGTDNASYVSQNIPSPMTPGAVVPVSVTMTNTGNTTWSEANLFRGFVPSGGTWGIPSQRVIMPAGDSVPPGATYTFNFNMTAPTTPGVYNFQWQMVHDGFAVFGQAAPAVSIAVGAVNHSSFVSQSTIPTAMTANQAYPVTITMQNIGGTTWAPGSYSLQPQNPAWAPAQVDLATSVAPGQSNTFTFNATPLVAGSKPFAWKMAQGTTAFGASSTSVTVSITGTDDATFVSQTVPGPMVPGQVYPVSVTMQNTGTTTWSEANMFRLAYPLSGQNWGVPSLRVLMPAGTSVPPGGSYTFSFNVTAPTPAGTYNFQWTMVHDGVSFFGPWTPNVAVAVNGVNDAQLMNQSVPSSMVPGARYRVFFDLKNTGNTTWAPGSYWLGSMNAADNTTWGTSRVDLATPVNPGDNVIVDFNVTAPATAGTYNLQWQMTQRGTRFGALTTNVPVMVSPGDNAAFVSQSVPGPMAPGQSYPVTVTLQNTGGTSWAPGIYYLASMNPQDNVTWGLNRVDLTSAVAAGTNVTLTFNVTAPTTAGIYNLQWQMTNAGTRFGAITPNVPVSVTATTASGQLYYIQTDHLDTPRLIADQAGNTVWRNDNIEPFGDSVPNGDPAGTGNVFEFNLRFPGQHADRETGSFYNYFRDYDPAIGRYIQSDLIGLRGGLNTYLYAFASPTELVDTRGLSVVCLPNRRACVWVNDPPPTTLPPDVGGGVGDVPQTDRERPTERPNRPESRPERPVIKLEPAHTDNPIIFPDNVPYIPPENCPPDCRQEQQELNMFRSKIIASGSAFTDVIAFNLLARDHNRRCGLVYYVAPLEIAQ